MTTAIASPSLTGWSLPSEADISSLAEFPTGNPEAISFFFGRQACSEPSLHRERLLIQQLIKAELKSDAGLLATAVQEAEDNPCVWRACYVGPSSQFQKQFVMPATFPSEDLKKNTFFFLAPLLKAVQSCKPYSVLLVERGHARVFHISGMQVEEEAPPLDDVKFERRSEDNRVGWSKHVDHNLEHSAHAWFVSLSTALESRHSSPASPGIVIGCRADVRSELEPLLTSLESRIVGWIPFPGLQISPAKVLPLARPAIDRYELLRCEQILKPAEESGRQPVTGVCHVLSALESGRVRTLLLGDLKDEYLVECTRCRALQARPRSACYACGSGELVLMPADEACIRSALAHDAEILVYLQTDTNTFDGITASLRY